MILFPVDKNYCLLFNPEDKAKLYKTQHLGDDFAKSIFLSSCRSWLLMQPRYREQIDPTLYIKYHLYILDLLTRERINLPAFESDTGLEYPILWIDEKTNDYLVIGVTGTAGQKILISFKKGDNSWKKNSQVPSSYIDITFNMAYKDHKLYCLNYYELYILDFSGESPLQVFRISVRGYICFRPGPYNFKASRAPLRLQMNRWENKIVVTLRGDVLIVQTSRPNMCEEWDFFIYKMDSSKENKWEEVVSLGDESILLHLGITVLAKDLQGITSNSIYFTINDSFEGYEDNEIFIFNLDTRKVEKPHQYVSLSIPSSHARWFLPSFKRE